MPLIDMSIEERGYELASIALAVRTVGSCPAACHRPDARILFGIDVLAIVPDPDGGSRFAAGCPRFQHHKVEKYNEHQRCVPFSETDRPQLRDEQTSSPSK